MMVGSKPDSLIFATYPWCCLLTFSRHPSEGWGDDQKREAEKYGKIMDIAFPQVPPTATSEEKGGYIGKGTGWKYKEDIKV